MKPPLRFLTLKTTAALAGLLLACMAVAGQEKISESVQVVNVEIVARVFAGGRLVGGLKKEDFTLYENGKKAVINGFWEQRQRMKAADRPRPESEAGAPGVRPGRLFVLYLWLYEPQVRWAEAIDYFLDQVWRPGDRVILAFGDQTIDFRDAPGREAAMPGFAKRFNEYLLEQRQRRERMVADLEAAAQDFINRVTQLNLGNARGYIASCFMDLRTRYLAYLTDFYWQYLNASETQLQRFIESLGGIDAEKWVIVLSQREAPPVYRLDSRLVEVAKERGCDKPMDELLAEADKRFQFPRDLPSYIKRFRSGVISARTTFHLLLLESKEKDKLNSENVARPDGTSNWEALLRDMSRDTGGVVVDGNELRPALEEAAEKEDIHYVLTFAPAEEATAELQLKLEVDRPGMKAVYANRAMVRETFPLAIGAVRFQEPVLELDLAGYQRIHADDRLAGRVALTILARGAGGTVSEWHRELDLPDERMTVSLRLNLPDRGKYDLDVGVTDLNSGRTARVEKEIEAAAGTAAKAAAAARERTPAAGLQLLDALEKSGRYCEKLKHSAFRFVCDEEVQETQLKIAPGGKRWQTNRWLYDYQIVGREQDISEKRTLLRQNGRPRRVEDAAPATRIVSYYGFLLPVTFLARENRDKFDYRLAGDDKVDKRRCLVVEAVPRRGESDGDDATRLWIDGGDGSVLKIELATPTIKGIEALRDAARRKGMRLEVRDSHWYGLESGGVRFPSATQLRELYKYDLGKHYGRGGGELEVNRIDIAYKNYRFFEVNTELKIEE